MNELLAVFKSRCQAIDCLTKLCALSVPASLACVPEKLCGGSDLCVEFPRKATAQAERIIAENDYSSFCGYLKRDLRCGNFLFKRL